MSCFQITQFYTKHTYFTLNIMMNLNFMGIAQQNSDYLYCYYYYSKYFFKSGRFFCALFKLSFNVNQTLHLFFAQQLI